MNVTKADPIDTQFVVDICGKDVRFTSWCNYTPAYIGSAWEKSTPWDVELYNFQFVDMVDGSKVHKKEIECYENLIKCLYKFDREFEDRLELMVWEEIDSEF